MTEKIGEIFVRKKIITPEQLEIALQEQTQTGEFLGEIFVRMSFVNEETLLKVLAEQFKTHYVALSNVHINPQAVKAVAKDLVHEYKFFPIEMRNSVMLIAISNPLDMWPMSILQEKLKLIEVQTVLARKGDIADFIKKYYTPGENA